VCPLFIVFPQQVFKLHFQPTGYYDGATELYEYGWAKSFHFSRFYKGEGFTASLARHEHYLAAQMSLRPGMRVLDVGCGVGGPAREIARFADVNIVGLNNNDFQIQRARRYTKQADLDNQVSFVKGDFMKLAEQFGENSFDAGGVFLFFLPLCAELRYSVCHRGHRPRSHMGRCLWRNYEGSQTWRSCMCISLTRFQVADRQPK
jgi:SAM-dependent methyltransferase